MRIGVVGGTFDPIHEGHLALARAARRCAQLDRVLLIPAAVPPHRAPAIASDQERLQMARLAAGDEFEVSDVEIRRGGPSYTVDTLRELAAAHPDAGLFLVLGWDAARELRSWREPEAVLALARLVIVDRPGLAPPSAEDLRRAGLNPARVELCDEPTPEVSASELRDGLAHGAPVDHLMPAAVAEFIAQRGLYGRDRRA